MHPSKHASLSLCVHVCVCEMCLHASLSLCVHVCVCEMCLHASVHNIMCSAQPEVAAVLDWYGPKTDPAYWQEVAGLQVACEAHNLHVEEISWDIPQNFRPSYTDHFSI